MKKLLLIVFGFVSMLGYTTAWNVSQINLTSKYSACTNESVDVNYYISTNHISHPYDTFWNIGVDSLISAQYSSVQIWRNGVISGCSNWQGVSNIVKGTDANGVLVLQNADGCVFTKPNYLKIGNNANKIDAQIHYTIGFYEKGSRYNPSLNGKFYYRDYGQNNWTCYSGGRIKADFNECPSTTVHYKNTVKQHVGECLNYRIFRCGDGLVNGYNGSTNYNNDMDSNGAYLHSYNEECDPNDPNHTNWGTNGCTPTCKRNDTPSNPTACTITLSSNNITLGDPVVVNYQIVGGYTNPTAMYLNSPFSQGNFLANIQLPEGTITIDSESITSTGTYTFYISGYTSNGSGFSCNALLNVSAPTQPESTSCTIELSTDSIALGDSFTVNYQISGSFSSPTHMYVTGQILGSWPHVISNSQGTIPVGGTSIMNTGVYRFWISGDSLNGLPFYCEARLNVTDNTGHANITITKILETTGPFSVGDYIRYKIVARNNGNITVMDSIWDEMPYSVDYLTSSIVFIPELNVHQNFSFSTGIHNGKFVFRYDNLLFAPGQEVVIYLTGVINDTYVDESIWQQIIANNTHFGGDDCYMDMVNKVMISYYEDLTRNCAYTYVEGTGNSGSGTVTGSCVVPPTPVLIKYQSVRGMDFTRDKVAVAKNELITYKVVFGNESGSNMVNVTLRDDLPSCVDYLSSSVYGINGYTFSTGSYNGSTSVMYQGFTLGSGQYGYMILTGKISNRAECQNADVYRNDASLIYQGGYLQSHVVAKRPDVLLTKSGDGPHYNLSQSNAFFITVTNDSNDTLYDVTLSEVDSWPTFNDCVTYIDWKGTNFTKDPNALIWKYNSPLQPGQSISLTISGTIGSDASCVRDYINTVVLTYKDGAGYEYTLDAKYPFDVVAGEFARLTKVVDKNKVGMNDYVTYTITYTNIGNVDRNTGYTLTDKWPGDVLNYEGSNCDSIPTCSWTKNGNDIVFTFDSVLHPGEFGTLILTGKVRNSWSNKKWNFVTLDYSTIFGTRTLEDKDYIEYEEPGDNSCGNGIKEGKEECDGGYDRVGWNDKDWFYIFNYLDYNHTELAGDDIAGKGYYCTKNCKLKKTSSSGYNIPSCLNVDTAISIMDNEVFPFWWRIWQRDGIKMVNGGKKSTDCSKYSTSKTTVINKDTMKCTFAVYDGKSYNQADRKPLNKLEDQPCFSDKNSDLDKFFEPFSKEPCVFSWCVDFDKVASRQAWGIRTLLGNNRNGTYGEHKLALEKVEYQYCAEDGTWRDGALYDAVCEVDFALTKSYLMQINTSGTPKATSAGFVDKFYDIMGNKISTDLSNVIKVNSKSYNMNSAVNSQIAQFKNKYEKLAVKVTSEFGNGFTVKKVPNQSIYFIEGNGNLTLNSGVSYVSKPFTLFVKGNVKIDGSILVNGMVITEGTITFEDSDCTSGGQVVQGIFIAQNGFISNPSTLNSSTKRARCHRGNLNVKGVLIGNGVDNITNSKRSQLNSWFETEEKYRTTADKKIISERRNEIIRGASVLIEYNQNVWSKTIPGAEIFTQTLDVYRK